MLTPSRGHFSIQGGGPYVTRIFAHVYVHTHNTHTHKHPQGEGYLVTMVHCDGSEGEEMVRTHLLHRSHLVLHVEGLSTGYSKEVHGEVGILVSGTSSNPGIVVCVHL